MKTTKKFVEVQVKDIMTSRIQSVMVNDTLRDAVSLMMDNELTTLPVVDGDRKCVGILSRSDLTELFLKEDQELSETMSTEQFSMKRLQQSLETCEDRKVNELMTYEVVSIGQEQNLSEVCRAMVRKQIHHLPVTDENEKLVGILSTFDIVKAVAEAE